MVNECFVLSSTDLAAMFAEQWPADFQRLKADLPAWTLFYTVAGYEYYPEERVSVNIKDITALTQRLGLEPAKSVGGLSARDILKAVQRPSPGALLEAALQGGLRGRVLPGHQSTSSRVSSGSWTVWRPKPATRSPTGGSTSSRRCRARAATASSTSSTTPATRARRSGCRNLAASATKTLMDNGAFFSRPYGESAGMIMNRDAATVGVLKKLKQIFDPNEVMNPGKLCF